jgi:uncharacterized protein
MPVIDFHVHLFPDDLARTAIPELEKTYGIRACLDGTVYSLEESMERAGVDLSIVQSVATKPSQVQTINNWLASIASRKISPFASIHPACEDAEDEIMRIKDLGFTGVKLHPDYQKFYPDDEKMFHIYEEIINNELIAFFHAGEDSAFKDVRGTPERFSNLIDIFPELTMVLAHFGGHRMWDEVERCLVGKDVYLETSLCSKGLSREGFVDLAMRHGPGKVIFGTDSPWADQEEEVGLIQDLDLGDEEKEAILCGNAAQLLGLNIGME